MDCSWNTWGQWSKCSVTCGTGNQRRTRTKAQQATNGGNQCTGLPTVTRNCNTQSCPGETQFLTHNIYIYFLASDSDTNEIIIPVDCSWNAWTEWSSCSVTCGTGTKLRTRFVAQQAMHGGASCPGQRAEAMICTGMHRECSGLTDCQH